MPAWKITKIKTLLSAIFDFQFLLHSAQIQSLNLNLSNWNQPIRKREISFTILKAISHSLRNALGIPLWCTLTKIRLLYIPKIGTQIDLANRKDFSLARSTIYFLNDCQIHQKHLAGATNQGRGWERTFNPGELSIENYRRKIPLNSLWFLTVSSISNK